MPAFEKVQEPTSVTCRRRRRPWDCTGMVVFGDLIGSGSAQEQAVVGAIAWPRSKAGKAGVSALLRPACPIEFGTGFLPPETGASKRDLKPMSPRRDRKSETTTREKSPQKRPF